MCLCIDASIHLHGAISINPIDILRMPGPSFLFLLGHLFALITSSLFICSTAGWHSQGISVKWGCAMLRAYCILTKHGGANCRIFQYSCMQFGSKRDGLPLLDVAWGWKHHSGWCYHPKGRALLAVLDSSRLLEYTHCYVRFPFSVICNKSG